MTQLAVQGSSKEPAMTYRMTGVGLRSPSSVHSCRGGAAFKADSTLVEGAVE
jgi:hypothetical protein